MMFRNGSQMVIGLIATVFLAAGCSAEQSVTTEADTAVDTAVETVAAPEGSPSLYDRLGGVYNIALVVDDFIDRVADNDTLNANPQVYAHREPLRFPGLKFQLTAMVCQATGGPCNYIGKSMLETHDGWMITEEEWQSMAGNFKATLDKFEVPEAEQQELFTIVESTKGDIVVSEPEPE